PRRPATCGPPPSAVDVRRRPTEVEDRPRIADSVGPGALTGISSTCPRAGRRAEGAHRHDPAASRPPSVPARPLTGRPALLRHGRPRRPEPRQRFHHPRPHGPQGHPPPLGDAAAAVGIALTTLAYIVWWVLILSTLVLQVTEGEATVASLWQYVAILPFSIQMAVVLPLAPLIIWWARAMMYAQLRTSAVRMSPTQFPE